MLKYHTTFPDPERHNPKTGWTEESYSVKTKSLQFFNRLAIFVPLNSGQRYLEVGVYDQQYFDQKQYEQYLYQCN